jgi:glutathione S-transferase
MLVVHHLENSRSQRVLWLLEELGVPYEVRRYARHPQTMRAPAELRAVHPLGKSPLITDGDEPIAETGAIVEYLLERYDAQSRFAPARGTAEHRRFRYWLHYAEGSAMPPLLLKLVTDRIDAAPMPFFVKPVAKQIVQGLRTSFLDEQIATHMDFIESELVRSPWFAGPEFSAADVQMSFPLEVAAQRVPQQAARRATAGFLSRIHARAAYQRALQAGGPYAYH